MFAVKMLGSEEQQFHINDPKPPVMPIDEIVWFYADGDELIHLKRQFYNIPISLFESCRWTGEMAAFVYHNLDTKTWATPGTGRL